MTRLGSHRLGTESISGTFSLATPTVAITAPTGAVIALPFTVSWTYSSPVGRPQVQYRITITNLDATVTVFDTFNVMSAATSVAISPNLTPGSSYTLRVTAADIFGFSAPASSFLLFDVPITSTWPIETKVGSVYEVAINGVGYMLADHPDRDSKYTRRVVPLDTPRFATGETPFSQAIDRYTLIGSNDWTGGAGQSFYDRDASSPSAFAASSQINPFEPGQLTLNPLTISSATYSGSGKVFLAVASGILFLAQTGSVQWLSDPTDATLSSFTIAGAAAPVDFTSDGRYWYYTDGANIYRNNTTASAAAWSTIDAQVIEWCTDRIVIARKGGSSTVANVVEVVNYSTGVAVGGTQAWTFEEETNVRSITSGDGYLFWAATRFDKSVIYAWKMGSTDSYITAFQMPQGAEARNISYYQGNVFIRASEVTDTGYRTVIYRAATSNGTLIPARVMEMPDSSLRGADGDFAGDDRFVYFSWSNTSTFGPTIFSGIGAIDLSTGGFCKWLIGGQGTIRSIVQYGSRTAWSWDDGTTGGFEFEDADQGVGSGFLDTSRWDLGTGLRKVYERVDLRFDPLPAGTTITIQTSTDGGITFAALGTANTAGTTSASFFLGREADTLSLRLIMNPGASLVSPVIRSATIRAYPIGLADEVVELSVNCADRLTGLNNRPLPESAAGAGALRARLLESLASTRVQLQDVDWAITKQTQLYTLIGVEIVSAGVFDSHVNRQSQGMVARVTLRRNLK